MAGWSYFGHYLAGVVHKLNIFSHLWSSYSHPSVQLPTTGHVVATIWQNLPTNWTDIATPHHSCPLPGKICPPLITVAHYLAKFAHYMGKFAHQPYFLSHHLNNYSHQSHEQEPINGYAVLTKSAILLTQLNSVPCLRAHSNLSLQSTQSHA